MDRKGKVLAAIVMIVGLLTVGAGSALADTTHCVDPTGVSCSTSCDDVHATIQAAVDDAAPGDTVHVCAETYDEQIKITKSLTLQGNGFSNTTIKPSSVTANTTNLATDESIAAIVLVDGAADVAVTDLTIDGDPAGDTFSCAPGFVGIFYRASSGSIERTHVTNIVHPSSLGCQAVLGIFVQSDTGGPGPNANVAILGNLVDNYGKNGVTANEAGTSVTVNLNAVIGLGDVSGVAAQNGVQIGFGARGRVTNNFIAYNDSSSDRVLSCGVLFFQARGGVGPVAQNIFTGNEQNICSASGGSSLHLPSD